MLRRFGTHALRRGEYFAVAMVVAFVAVFGVGGALIGGADALRLLARPGPLMVAGMLGLSLANYALRIWRWQVFGDRLAIPVPLARTALYYTAGFAMTATPGKLGEALRLWFLERCHGVRYLRAAPLFVADRVSDANSIVLLCLVGLTGFAAYAWAAWIAIALVGGATLMLMKPAWLGAAVGAAYGLVRRRPRSFAAIRAALRSTALLFRPRVYLFTLALGTLGWLAESVAFHWLLNEFGAPVTLEQSMFIFAFSMLVGAISMLPGGLGGTEATMLALLLSLGVGSDVALAATALIRITTLWFAVVLGFIALPGAMRLARHREATSLPAAL